MTSPLDGVDAFAPQIVRAGNEAWGAWARGALYVDATGASGALLPKSAADEIAARSVWERLADLKLAVLRDDGVQLVPPFFLSADPPKKRAAAKPLASAVRRVPEVDYAKLIDAYHLAFIRERGTKPVISANTGKAAKRLLEMMPLADAIECVEVAFEDKWFARNGGELHTIAAAPNKYRRARGASAFDVVLPAPPARPATRTPDEDAEIQRRLNELDDLARTRRVGG